MNVHVERCPRYSPDHLDSLMDRWSELFSSRIFPGQTVVLKPNWLTHAHKQNPEEWQSVITHPAVTTAVLKRVLACLKGEGRVVITDGPQTDSSWDRIMNRLDPDLWVRMGRDSGIEVQVIDLREHEWTCAGDVKVASRSLPGDPRGSTVCDLAGNSEFVDHRPSQHGYYGADYDKAETNRVHSNGHHMYKVSRTAIEADVFINLPKLKTHKKAGITCSLKNLVGINTYKNWLPHHNEGTPEVGGDQFPSNSVKNRTESLLNARFKAVLTNHPALGKWLVPVKGIGRRVFGDTMETIRNGAWHGNDTLWRMVLDLNKILLYANPDGQLRPGGSQAAKPYLSIVDGIIAGEGNGPEAPIPKPAGLMIAGTNPVAVDMLCARLMGFDWKKIPSLQNAYSARGYPLADFDAREIMAISSNGEFSGRVLDIPRDKLLNFRPHFGWVGHIELLHSEAA